MKNLFSLSQKLNESRLKECEFKRVRIKSIPQNFRGKKNV